MVRHMKTYLLCTLVVLVVGARAGGQELKTGLSGDFAVMAEHTLAFPGNVEYGSAFFYGRMGYTHMVTESVGLFVEGHFGRGYGVEPEFAIPGPDLTLWGVNELANETFGIGQARQLYVQTPITDRDKLIVGQVALSELIGPDIGGRSKWDSFVAPGFITDPLIPFPVDTTLGRCPGFAIYYGIDLSPATTVRCAYGDPDADWDNILHKDGGFFIAEIEQKLGETDMVRVMLWGAPQVTCPWDATKEQTPIGISVDSRFRLGQMDTFFRLGSRPSDYYTHDMVLSGGLIYPTSETSAFGFGLMITPWSQKYLDDLANTFGMASEIQAEVFYRTKVRDVLQVIADVQILLFGGGVTRDGFVGTLDGGDPERQTVGTVSVRACLPF